MFVQRAKTFWTIRQLADGRNFFPFGSGLTRLGNSVIGLLGNKVITDLFTIYNDKKSYN
jgi:hypothetical protein